ncbi:general stress protein [Zhihengliuella flava]|uniref:General stress protein 17M-like domain-containing protein n=1 Tax=Zhihengliuella flava TaxID=1285193 RepID=A0A931DAX1_9MICC|nr:general stress protein [Zhihengliuella flava]MBG6085554.1 hypothetical protein [Zhihengliuella flava]
MTTPFGAPTSVQDLMTLPRGEVLGRYESYLDAQKVVDYLADNDFPVSNVSIVGCDLKTVERVTMKLSYPRVALRGAAQGVMFGLFVGLLLSLFNEGNPLGQIFSSVGLGVAIWMIVAVIGYAMRRGKRDFESSNQIMAGYYDVVVGFEHIHAARQLASSLPMSSGQAGSVTPAWAPPRDASSTGSSASAPSAGSATPASPSSSDQPAADSAPAGVESRRSGYADLPDGRPQFGVRVEPTPAQEPTEPQAEPEAEQTSGEPAAEQPQAESGTDSASTQDTSEDTDSPRRES